MNRKAVQNLCQLLLDAYSQQVEHIKFVPKIVRNGEKKIHQIIQIPMEFLSHYETLKGSVTVFALHLNCSAKALAKANKTHEKG